MPVEIKFTHEGRYYQLSGEIDSYIDGQYGQLFFLDLGINHWEYCNILFARIPEFLARYPKLMHGAWPARYTQREIEEQIEFIFDLLDEGSLEYKLKNLGVSEVNIKRIMECNTK